MKLFLIVFLLLASCTKTPQVCNAGKIAANVVAIPISQRWVCNVDKIASFLEAKVQPYTCPEPTPALTEPAKAISIQQMLCPLVIGSLVDLGADKIVADFECNKEKVVSDLSGTTKLCELFNSSTP